MSRLPSNLIRFAARHPSARLTLFCLPHAGGASSSFRGWSEALGTEIELATIQMPGREDRFRETAYETMEAAIAPIAKAMAPHLGRPFAVLGHSLGALVGFEVIHRVIREYGKLPLAFFPSACRAPYHPHPLPCISHLPDSEFVEIIQARYGGIPPMILEEPAYLQVLLSPLRADFRILEGYRFLERPLLSCPLLIFGGERDTIISREGLEAWRTLSSGECNLTLLDAGHLYLQSHREQMTTVIRRSCLKLLDLL